MKTSTETQPSTHDTIATGLPDGLAIRSLHVDDAAMCAHHGNNYKVWINMTDMFPYPYTLQDGEKWIKLNENKEHWIQGVPSSSMPGSSPSLILPNYAITLKGAFIGGIGLKPQTDIERRNAEVGYWIGEEHWGKGYMTVVLQAFIEWVWNTFPDLVRLDARVAGRNPGSGKVLKKAGFELEGVRRKGIFKDGKLDDCMLWALLRDGI